MKLCSGALNPLRMEVAQRGKVIVTVVPPWPSSPIVPLNCSVSRRTNCQPSDSVARASKRSGIADDEDTGPCRILSQGHIDLPHQAVREGVFEAVRDHLRDEQATRAQPERLG
jgi:hypothetical protein